MSDTLERVYGQLLTTTRDKTLTPLRDALTREKMRKKYKKLKERAKLRTQGLDIEEEPRRGER